MINLDTNCKNPENQISHINELKDDCLLRVFQQCDGPTLFHRTKSVCQYWNRLIMNPENQKFILFRAVFQLTHGAHRRSDDFVLAKNISTSIRLKDKERDDQDYFRNLNNEITNYESKLLNLLSSWKKYDSCKDVVINLLIKGQRELVASTDLETLQNHIIKLIHIMFQFLKDQDTEQGYASLIFDILQRLLPFFEKNIQKTIADELKCVLFKKEQKIVIQAIEKEATSLYFLLKCLCASDSLEIQQSATTALGLMVLHLPNHQYYPWISFLDKFAGNPAIQQYFFMLIKVDDNEKIDFGCTILALLELESVCFLQCLQAHIEKFVFFFEQLLDNDISIFNHSTVRGLLAIVYHPRLNLDQKLEEKIRLSLQRYFQIDIKFCDMKIQGNKCLEIADRTFVDFSLRSPSSLRNELLSYLLENNSSNEDYILAIRNLISKVLVETQNISGKDFNIREIIPKMLAQASKKKLGFFMSRILEKLMLSLSDEDKLEIINIFKSNLYQKHMVLIVEKDFDSYFRVFKQLCQDQYLSCKVKAEVAITVGVMALNLSEKYRYRTWALFLITISQEKEILAYVRREISLSEGLLKSKINLVKLNFAETTRQLLEQNCPSIIQCFNEYPDNFILFFDDQLLNIRKISVKVDVTLALIAFCITKNINENDAHINKIKKIIKNQFLWTPLLLQEIEEKIKKLILFHDFKNNLIQFLEGLKDSQLISTGSTLNTSRTSSSK